MNTGTCKGLLLGALFLGLAACEDFAAFDLDGSTGENLALRGAKLAGGTIKLVPPPGFCVDKRSLRQSFALMARCDTLGGRVTTNAPLAIITATTVKANNAAQISTSEFESTSETVIKRIEDAPLALVQIKGTPPSPDMRDTYWRGAARIGDHVIGLTLYERANGTSLGDSAPNLLVKTIEQTQEQSIVAAVTFQDNSATQAPKPAGRGFLSGLFE
ncbi:hypothetical protein [uncultured Tateyamaria sp.]|uniref:hypothetical protein n=1 Tax=uncultured Tateyamaria sp. TaxID=455651 RepID=UPI002603015A|nr:hypothetical protein [uncultured Tateyamaria sp.]